MKEGARWLTAEAVASILGVHRKTVRLWARHQPDAPGAVPQLRGFTTEGKHLRFAPSELQAYLAAMGEPLDPTLAERRPKVAVVFESRAVLKLCEKALARRFDIATYTHMSDALLQHSTVEPEAWVFDPNEAPEVTRACIEALRRNARTTFIKTLAFTRDAESPPWPELCNAVVPHALPGGLKSKLSELLGVL
jgi:Helix-turn-helix domain